MSTHGGSRKGAGRKPLPDDERRVAITIRTDQERRQSFSDECQRRELTQGELFAEMQDIYNETDRGE